MRAPILSDERQEADKRQRERNKNWNPSSRFDVDLVVRYVNLINVKRFFFFFFFSFLALLSFSFGFLSRTCILYVECSIWNLFIFFARLHRHTVAATFWAAHHVICGSQECNAKFPICQYYYRVDFCVCVCACHFVLVLSKRIYWQRHATNRIIFSITQKTNRQRRQIEWHHFAHGKQSKDESSAKNSDATELSHHSGHFNFQF